MVEDILLVLGIDSSFTIKKCHGSCPSISAFELISLALQEETVERTAQALRVSTNTLSRAINRCEQLSVLKSRKGGANLRFVLLDLIGVKRCPGCLKDLKFSNYHSDSGARSGVYSLCSTCSISKGEKYRHANATSIKEYSCRHYRENKQEYLARNAKRRALKLKATPSWSETDLIKEFYVNCPEGCHVDHVIPLQGELVCGLHVIVNLQYLTARDNLSKGNKFIANCSNQ